MSYQDLDIEDSLKTVPPQEKFSSEKNSLASEPEFGKNFTFIQIDMYLSLELKRWLDERMSHSASTTLSQCIHNILDLQYNLEFAEEAIQFIRQIKRQSKNLTTLQNTKARQNNAKEKAISEFQSVLIHGIFAYWEDRYQFTHEDFSNAIPFYLIAHYGEQNYYKSAKQAYSKVSEDNLDKFHHGFESCPFFKKLTHHEEAVIFLKRVKAARIGENNPNSHFIIKIKPNQLGPIEPVADRYQINGYVIIPFNPEISLPQALVNLFNDKTVNIYVVRRLFEVSKTLRSYNNAWEKWRKESGTEEEK